MFHRVGVTSQKMGLKTVAGAGVGEKSTAASASVQFYGVNYEFSGQR
jgi:hypothetical protein